MSRRGGVVHSEGFLGGAHFGLIVTRQSTLELIEDVLVDPVVEVNEYLVGNTLLDELYVLHVVLVLDLVGLDLL